MKAHQVLPLIALAVLVAIHDQPITARTFSDWAAPTNLGCEVNSPFGEQGPAISKNGLSLYFGSLRPGGFGMSDIWVSQRPSIDDPWGSPVNLGVAINTPGADNIPVLSRDGHYLFFNSDRSGSSGLLDIWVSYRAHVHDDFGWQPPVNVGAGVNSPGIEAGATLFENEHSGAPSLFFGRGLTLADTDIYASELQSGGRFGDAVLVPELNSAYSDQRPSVRFDGLEIFQGSERPGSVGLSDVWVSARESVFDAWSTPTNLGATVNSAFADTQPHIAPDRRTLFFTSNRPGGCGALDIYMTTRTKVHD